MKATSPSRPFQWWFRSLSSATLYQLALIRTHEPSRAVREITRSPPAEPLVSHTPRELVLRLDSRCVWRFWSAPRGISQPRSSRSSRSFGIIQPVSGLSPSTVPSCLGPAALGLMAIASRPLLRAGDWRRLPRHGSGVALRGTAPRPLRRLRVHVRSLQGGDAGQISTA